MSTTIWTTEPGDDLEALPVVDDAPAPRPAPSETDSDADPAWVRPALLVLLGATAVLYLWGLGASGWANAYYSAAVQAGTKSWKAFLFGSFDSGNFITVDKTPASLWPMEISARLFGVNAWSILVPQALEGVAAVGLLYATVRRWFGALAGLIAGATLALTPVAALMFRYNNPDALLTLTMVAAAWAITRALDDGRTRWLVLCGAVLGFGFLAKELQVLLVCPGIGLAYLLAGPPKLGRRIAQLLALTASLLVAAGWWIALVELWPAGSRPYIGGSQNNSFWNVLFGYNGFGRLSGNETGSVGGGRGPQGPSWGPTGWGRMFNSQFGGQISWLLPAALILLGAAIVWTLRRERTDRLRAAMIVWGGWLLVTGAAFSFGQGIIHEYYSVALAPAVGAIVGIVATQLWRHRRALLSRVALAVALAATALWTGELLSRSPQWWSSLHGPFVVAGLVLAAAIVACGARVPRAAAAWLAGAALVVGVAAPAAATVTTVRATHTGALPLAGPASTGGRFGPGGRGGFGPFARRGFARLRSGANGIVTLPFGPFGGNANGAPPSVGAVPFPGGFPFPGGPFPGGQPPGGQLNGGPIGGGSRSGRTFGGRPFGGGPGGGLLDASTPSAALTALLQRGASGYRWAAATVGANSAAGYQLASGEPIMALGGFNGSDPAPSLAQFEQYVAQRAVHYFIGGGFGGFGGRFAAGFGPSQGGSNATSQITAWVTSHFKAVTVGGQTVYDLTQPTA